MNNDFLKGVIEGTINDLIKEFEIDYPIDNVDDTLFKMGCEVVEVDSNILFDEEDVFERVEDRILLKIPKGLKRDRAFKVAQAFGFFVVSIASRENIKGAPISSLEKTALANFIATSFLMPKDIFLSVIKKNLKNGVCQTSLIAEYFNVSVNDVELHGRQLGVFDFL